MTTTGVAAPGTCKLQGCPGWGRHDPHVTPKIGAGSWEDYTKPTHCLGTPVIRSQVDGALIASCSIAGQMSPWDHIVDDEITPAVMAGLVDRHKAECTNRSAG